MKLPVRWTSRRTPPTIYSVLNGSTLTVAAAQGVRQRQRRRARPVPRRPGERLVERRAVLESDGSFTDTPNANFTGTDTFTYLDNDGADGNTATVTITVYPADFVNQPPSFTKGPDQTVNEDSGPQTVNPWATGIMRLSNDAGQHLNFIVRTDNDSLFSAGPAIDPVTGTLKYTPADHVFGAAHEVGEVARRRRHRQRRTRHLRGAEFHDHRQLRERCADVHQGCRPGGQRGQRCADGEPVGDGNHAGPANEAGQHLNFIVSTDNDSLFAAGPSIDPSTGGADLYAGATRFGVAHVTVKLHDDGGTAFGGQDTSVVQSFTITVNFVIHAPSFTKVPTRRSMRTVACVYGGPLGDRYHAGPANESGEHLNFIISTDNDSLFSAGPSLDPSTGTLTYTPALHAYGVAHVSVKLHDDGGTDHGGLDTSAVQNFTITVSFVNDAPAFTQGADQTVNEDSGADTVNPWATGISAVRTTSPASTSTSSSAPTTTASSPPARRSTPPPER